MDPARFKTIGENDIGDTTLEGIIKLFPQISEDQVIVEWFYLCINGVLKLLLNGGDNMDSNWNNSNICGTYPSSVYETDFMTRHIITFMNFIKSSAYYQLLKSNARGHFQS